MLCGLGFTGGGNRPAITSSWFTGADDDKTRFVTRIYDASTGRLEQRITWPLGRCEVQVTGPAGKPWVLLTPDWIRKPFIRELWEGLPLRRVATLRTPGLDLVSVLFSPGRRYLLLGNEDGVARLYRIAGR